MVRNGAKEITSLMVYFFKSIFSHIALLDGVNAIKSSPTHGFAIPSEAGQNDWQE